MDKKSLSLYGSVIDPISNFLIWSTVNRKIRIKTFLAFLTAALGSIEAGPVEEQELSFKPVQSGCGALLDLGKDGSDSSGEETTSYVGTTTGPGPNGGYASTPRGAYPVEPPRFFYKDRDE